MKNISRLTTVTTKAILVLNKEQIIKTHKLRTQYHLDPYQDRAAARSPAEVLAYARIKKSSLKSHYVSNKSADLHRLEGQDTCLGEL